VPRGRPKTPEYTDPPITLEEAKKRRFWAIFRVARGRYTCAPAGESCPGKWCGWAADKPSAMNACAQRQREDLHPEGGRHLDHADNKRRRLGR